MSVLGFIEYGILVYFLAMNGQQLVFLVRAYFTLRRYLDSVASDEMENLFGTTHYKPISLICPVYNEAAGCVASINSLLALRYPEFQVIVVNDGSKDETLERLVQAFRLRPSQRVIRQVVPTREIRGVYESIYVPNLVVVDKENGGKADALNVGLNFARYPLVCCMDGDSLLENDALLRIARPFLDTPNMVACGGVIRPLNGCKVTSRGIRGIHLPSNWLAGFQVVEYLRAFLYGRMGLSSYRLLFIVSGAFGVFRRDLLLKAGGFLVGTVGEDFEAIVRLHRYMLEQGEPYAIAMVPDPICWTEVPEDARTLRRQRNRWQRGLLDVLWLHRRMLFNPKYGRLGMASMPYFLFFEALAPIIEGTGYLVFLGYLVGGVVNTPFVVLFLLVAFFLGLLNSIVSILLEVNGGHRYQGVGPFLKLLFMAILENFGYRQLTLMWRLVGVYDWLRGNEKWGGMKRKGIESGSPKA